MNSLLPYLGSERTEQESRIVRKIRAQNAIFIIKKSKLENIT